MKVRVHFIGAVCDIVDAERIEVALPRGATIKGLLDHLVDRYGARFKEEVYAEGRLLRPGVTVVVKGIGTVDQSLLDLRLGERRSNREVEIVILPAFAAA